MMKLLCVLYFSIILSKSNIEAQGCTEKEVITMPGKWKQGAGGSITGNAADIARERKLVDAIHQMIQANYKPMGIQANYNGVYAGPVNDRFRMNNFGYSLYALHYYCKNNKLEINDETSSSLSIKANYFDSEIFDTATGDRALAEGFHVMYKMPVLKQGYWYFEDADEPLGFGITGKRRMWLVTYEGKLPFAFVSRKEFLEKRKLSLTNQMEMDASHSREVLKNMEIEKKYRQEELKNDPAKYEKYLKLDYLPSRERYEKLLAETAKRYENAFKKITEGLQANKDDLNNPAIVKQDPQDGNNYLFTEATDPFCRILIKPNPSYFNKKLPPSSPQFFWVYLKGNHKDPTSKKFLEDMSQAIDCKILEQMLGK